MLSQKGSVNMANTPLQYVKKMNKQTGAFEFIPINRKSKKSIGSQMGYNPDGKPIDKPDIDVSCIDYSEHEYKYFTQTVFPDWFENYSHKNDKVSDVLRQLQENNKKLRFHKRLKAGKIDVHSLVNYRTSDKLFKVKAIKDYDYGFTVILDTSGSMISTDKLGNAIKAIDEISIALKAVNIPLSIYGVNASLMLHKKPDEEISLDELKKRLAIQLAGVNWAGGTNEMAATKLIYEQIMKAPHKKNIVIVLSDGQPNTEGSRMPTYINGYWESNDSLDGQNRCEYIADFWRRAKGVNVYGIGLRSHCEQVDRHMMLNDLDELPTLIGKLVEEVIL